MTGHAGIRDGGLAQRANAAVHVLAAGAWFAALVPMLSLLDGPHAREAGITLRRFSKAGHAAVALVLTGSAVNTALIPGAGCST